MQINIRAEPCRAAGRRLPPPAVPNANHLNLIDNIERLRLGVDRILPLPLHGRVVALSELYTTARKAPPAR